MPDFQVTTMADTSLGQELVLRGSSTSSFIVGLLIISDLLRLPYNTIIFFPVTHFYHICDNGLCPLSSLSVLSVSLWGFSLVKCKAVQTGIS